MDISVLTNDEVTLAARAMSIHRASMRRKLDRLVKDSPEYKATLEELAISQRLVEKLNRADLRRIGAA